MSARNVTARTIKTMYWHAPICGVDPNETVSVAAEPLGDPTRVLFLGDTHGTDRWIGHVAKLHAGHVDVIVVAGDFGYWEHQADGVAFLDKVDWHLERRGLQLVFVDGNHENHTLLRNRYRPGDDGFVAVRPRIRWTPRGHRWTWSGRRFLALGGAHSVDRDSRLEGDSWWPEETITYREVTEVLDAQAATGAPVDVLVTHDAPNGVPLRLFGKIDTTTAANRAAIDAVVEAARPKLVVHGHYHQHHDTTLHLPNGTTTRVVGLANENCGKRSWLTVDLTDDTAFAT